MVATLSLLQVVLSLTVCACRSDDLSAALEDKNPASKEIGLLQLKKSDFTLDEKTVFKFPVNKNGEQKFIDIAKEIGTNRSEDFGTELLGMELINEIDNIIKEYPQSANKRMIQLWFEGDSENNVTCRFLAEVLNKIGMTDLANDMKTTCEHHNVLDERYIPRTVKRYSHKLSEKYEKEPIIETTLFLPKKLRGRKITYVDLEMEEKGVSISLQELFYNIQTGMRILFLGRPGVGKTTVTRHITKMLLESGLFHLVVKIHLSNVNESGNLENLLSVEADESFTSKPKKLQRISEFIQTTAGKGICFLLDGYDEYYPRSTYVNGLLTGNNLKKSVVILTSRPSAVDEIKDDFDRKVEIIGFGNDSVQTYLRQLQLPDAKYQFINDYLSNHPNVRQLCYLPLHLSMLVYVAVLTENDDALSLGDTETQLYSNFLCLTIRQYQEIRHEENVTSLTECFKDVHKKTDLCIIFRRIYQVSFEGLMPSARKNALKSTSFVGLPDSSNIPAKLEQLSLFKVVPIDDRSGVGLFKYYYSHPTFQEFFAAFHLTTLPKREQLKYIRYYWMHEVYKFFLGLIGEKLNYDSEFSEYLSQTFVNFSSEILSTYQNQELYLMKCSHEIGRNTSFVPLLQAAGVITKSNSVSVNTFYNHDCWYIGYALLQSSFDTVTIDKHNELALCISFITNYLKHERGISDRVNVEKLALGRYSEGYWPWFTEKEDRSSFSILMNFLPKFKKKLEQLELTFMKFEDNESVLSLVETLQSFEKLSSLALSAHVNVIKDGSVEIALKKLPFLNHLELGVINRHDDNTSIPDNLLEFKNLTNINSLTLALSWNKSLVNVNMTALVGGLEYLTNLERLCVRIILYEGFRVYGATELLQGIKRLSISELTLALDLCWDHGLGNVSVKELTTVLSNMTILRNLSLCIDFSFSGIRGNTGVTELSEGLKSLVNLQELYLMLRWELQMDESIDEGTEAIANALKQLNSLKVLKLDLSLNGSINEIASLFPFLPQLQEVQLNWSNIHNKTNASILLGGIKHLKLLKKLVLSRTKICDKDVTSLVDALKHLNVSTLDLSYNEIGDAGLKLLANAIESGYLSSLEALILAENAFSEVGAEILSQKVVNLQKLSTFDLGLRQGRYSALAMTQIYQLRARQQSEMKQHNESHTPLTLADIRTRVTAFVLKYKVVAAAFILGGLVIAIVTVHGKYASTVKYNASQTKDVFELVRSPDSTALNALSQCSASVLWKLRTGNNLDGRGTVIAILDSAVDLQYPTLQGKCISPVDCISWPVKFTEHGTLCTVVAIGSCVEIDEISLPEGVAPEANCIAYRVAENNLCDSRAILNALDDIEKKIKHENIPVDVVSISHDIPDRHNEISEKISKLTESKVVFVAAAGNSGRYQPRLCFPARLDCVISVGALDRNGKKCKFNFPGHIDAFAPGEDISFAQKIHAGTSFATPAIGGLVLLLKQRAKEIGPPACDYIHRVEILKKIFDEDMVVTCDEAGEKVFAPEEFFEQVTSGDRDLNKIVEKHLKAEKRKQRNESSMEID